MSDRDPRNAVQQHEETADEYLEDVARAVAEVHRDIDEQKVEVVSLSQTIRQLKTLYFQLKPEEAAALLPAEWRPGRDDS